MLLWLALVGVTLWRTCVARGALDAFIERLDAGEFTWALSASVLVVPHMLIDPQYPHACEAGGVIRCGLQAWLDVGPHGVPRGCELSGQSCNGGSFEAQLSDRPADRPGAQTRPGGAHPLVMFQECHRLAGGFAAYPAPLKPPEPCRDPGPGRVDHLHHHAPVALSDSAHTQGSQHSDHRTLCRSPDHTHVERQQPDGSPPNRRTDHADHNDQATQSSSRKGETPPEVLEGSGGRSPLIIKDLDLYPQPPTNTHSPTLNSEEPHFCRVDKRRKYEYVYKHAYEEYLRLRSGYGAI